MLCEFLLYNEINQPYAYIYPLSLEPPCHPPYPTPLCHQTALSWAPCAIQQVPTSYLFYTWYIYHTVYISILISQFIPPPFPLCVHMFILYICGSSCCANGFNYTMFLDFTRRHYYTIFVFSFWLTSLCMIDSRSIQIFTDGPISFLFMAE